MGRVDLRGGEQGGLRIAVARPSSTAVMARGALAAAVREEVAALLWRRDGCDRRGPSPAAALGPPRELTEVPLALAPACLALALPPSLPASRATAFLGAPASLAVASRPTTSLPAALVSWRLVSRLASALPAGRPADG